MSLDTMAGVALRPDTFKRLELGMAEEEFKEGIATARHQFREPAPSKRLDEFFVHEKDRQLELKQTN